jgi:DNA-binding Lrp family transcriptional regulator
MEKPQEIHESYELDRVDEQIISEMQQNARITNSELAERVGIAPSTCISRVRNLVSHQVITGFTARVDAKALGLELQVLISVTLRSGERQQISEFAEQLREVPGVTQLFFLGGVEDFIIHLMARDSDHVRDFVMAYLTEHPAVSTTRTSIVFSHTQNPVGITR